MKNTRSYILIIILALIVGYVGACLNNDNIASHTKEKSVLQEITERGTLKCGYAAFSPMLIVDPNTKKLSGISYDIMQEVGKKIGVKVEWAEEAGWGEFTQALENKRFDVFCTAHWPSVQRAKIVDFTKPFLFSPVSIYGRANDNRFDNNIEKLNQKTSRFSFIDGSTPSMFIPKIFPLASYAALPELTPVSNIFMEVQQNKADATMMDKSTTTNYMKANPGVLKLIPGGENQLVFANVFSVKKGEYQLQQMLDVALQELANEGEINRIVSKYEPAPNSYYRLLPSYNANENK